jgi:hypothetical protein
MRQLVVVLVIVMCTSGCLARRRLNSNCEWAGEPAVHLDLHRRADRVHLIEDVEIAEENGIRYGDSFRKHDGQAEEDRQRTRCTAALVTEISQVHGITHGEVERARGRRLWYVDWLVALVFGTLYYRISARFVFGLFGRVSVDDGAAAIVAVLVAALFMSLAGLMALNVFAMAIEVVRHADMHGSYRASRGLPWSHHSLAVIGMEMLLFIHVAVIHIRKPSRGICARVTCGHER